MIYLPLLSSQSGVGWWQLVTKLCRAADHLNYSAAVLSGLSFPTRWRYSTNNSTRRFIFNRAANDPSVFTTTGRDPTRTFSLLKALRAAKRYYAIQATRPLWPLRLCHNFTSMYLLCLFVYSSNANNTTRRFIFNDMKPWSHKAVWRWYLVSVLRTAHGAGLLLNTTITHCRIQTPGRG